MSDRPYVRVYHADMIRDYPEVWDDDAALAAWLRLLVLADGSWPAPAPLPRSLRARALGFLEERGLVVQSGSQRFRMKGMDAERNARGSVARNAAAKRWQSERNANAFDTNMPNRTEPNRTEPSRADAREDRADLEAFLLIKRRAPTPRQRQLLDGILDRHDLTGPAWAADIMLRHPDDPIGAVLEADKAWRNQRIAEAQAAEKPTPQPRRRGGLPESAKEILAQWAATAKEDDAA